MFTVIKNFLLKSFSYFFLFYLIINFSGNYVVQKMIHYGDEELRAKVCDALLPYVVQLCCNKAGSNILGKY